ncbi:MAG: hypothetical protein OEW09_11460 [Anaerolineae bacterium]|nr:hypothetical protein [Anaerolineae bacterium]
MDTILQHRAIVNLPATELESALSAFLEPVLLHLPEKRLREVGKLAVQGVIGGQSPVVVQMARGVRHEETTIWPMAKRLYRFIWNERFSHRHLLKGLYGIAQCTVAEHRPSHLVIALDPVNFEKAYTEALIETLINRVEDPLRHLGNYRTLIEGVTYAGYEQTVTLSESKRDDILSGVWNLIQLDPGGVILIPASPRVEVTDYMEPIDESLQTIHSNYVSVKITGNRQYKVGYKVAYVTGRLAYFNQLDGDRAYLIVRNFFNHPSSVYPEEPPDVPGQRGDSIHVYNDDGCFGGFGELEVNGQTIGAETGKSSSTDPIVLWLYAGAPDTPISLEAFLADQTGKYSVIARSAATKQSPAWQKEIASLRSQ